MCSRKHAIEHAIEIEHAMGTGKDVWEMIDTWVLQLVSIMVKSRDGDVVGFGHNGTDSFSAVGDQHATLTQHARFA